VGSTAISAELLNILLVPMVGFWVIHLYQRKFRDAGAQKRAATQWLTFLVIGAWAAAWAFKRFGVPDIWLLPVAAGAVGLVIGLRQHFLPFRFRCAQCGKTVSMTSMLCRDSNKCEACEPHATEGETTR
jgi:hypothetical protein